MTKYEDIQKVAQRAGAIVSRYFGHNLKAVEKKMPSDICTRADRATDAYIVNHLRLLYPETNIFSEEGGFLDCNSEYTFYIDPIDGSNNFVQGIPYFAVSIALTKKNKIIFGVVYNPITGNMFWAERGKGAFLTNHHKFKRSKRLSVSREKDISRTIFSHACGYSISKARHMKINTHLYSYEPERVLDNWCASMDLCLLAAGRIECVINDKNELYDHLAGKLIASEAGALITDFRGKREWSDLSNEYIASNNALTHHKTLKAMK